MRAGLALYALVLVVGIVMLIVRQEPRLEWAAARDLAASQMLQSSDVVPAGRQYFVKHAMKKGETISSRDLSVAPDLLAKENELAVGVAVDRSQTTGKTGLNVGADARLCKEGKALEPVTVRLLVCAPEGSACFALAAVPTARAAELASFFEKGPLPYLQSKQATPACK